MPIPQIAKATVKHHCWKLPHGGKCQRRDCPFNSDQEEGVDQEPVGTQQRGLDASFPEDIPGSPAPPAGNEDDVSEDESESEMSQSQRKQPLGSDDESESEEEELHVRPMRHTIVELSSSDDEDIFDIHGSREVIETLLTGLKSETQAGLMDELSQWFQEWDGRVKDNVDELSNWESENNRLEDEHVQAMKGLKNDIHNRDESMMVCMNEFTNLVGSMRRRADATAKEKEIFNSQRVKEQKIKAKEAEKEALLTIINDLREQLIAGELPPEDPENQNHHTDLLKILALQQDEIMKLTKQAEESQKRGETMKEALGYVDNGCNGKVSEAVLEIFNNCKDKVRSDKFEELEGRKKTGVDETVDDSEVQELERDIKALKERQVETKAEIESLRASAGGGEGGGSDDKLQARALGISGENLSKADVAERAPVMKARLLGEIAILKQERDKLSEQQRQYEELMQNAEHTIKSMEEQKTIFLVHIAQAKSTLLTQGEGAITSQKADDDDILGEDEDDEAAAAQNPNHAEREAKSLAALKEEEELMKREILALEMQLLVQAGARQAGAAAGAAAIVESEGASIAVEQGRRAGVVSLTNMVNALEGLEVAPLREEDARLCSRVESLRKRAIVERHRAGGAKRSSCLPPSDPAGTGDAAEGDDAENAPPAETGKEEDEDEEEEEVDELALEQEAEYEKDSWEESENQKVRRAQIHSDMLELIRVKDENSKLQQDLQAISDELARLKAQRNHPLDLGREGDEYPEVSEIRQKLREYTALRKKWWSERQDPKAICRRSLTHPETNGAVLCASTTNVGGIYSRILNSASQF